MTGKVVTDVTGLKIGKFFRSCCGVVARERFPVGRIFRDLPATYAPDC